MSIKKKKKQLRTIGRVDKADFPLLKLFNIEVKVDTGAYTAAIHCDHIEERTDGGEAYIQFKIAIPDENSTKIMQLSAYNYTLKNIKSSNGADEKRYVIESSIILFGKTYPINLSLTNRSNMRYPILLGRQLLKKRFAVDVSRKNLSYKRKLKRQCT